VEVRIPGADPPDSVLAHEARVVEQIACQVRKVRDDLPSNLHKTSISHDQALVRELRENPDFAAEYLRAALEDEEEPRVLLARRVAEARGGIAKVAKAAGVVPCRGRGH
jgi:hypothetical protein